MKIHLNLHISVCIQSNLRLRQPLISYRLSSPFRVNIKNIYFRMHKQFQNSSTLRIANNDLVISRGRLTP